MTNTEVEPRRSGGVVRGEGFLGERTARIALTRARAVRPVAPAAGVGAGR